MEISTVKPKDNVISIIKPEGKYSVLYGIHILSQDPREIPEDTGAVVLETGIVPYLSDPLEALNRLKEHIQYKELFLYLEEKRIPIIFSDIRYRVNNAALLLFDSSISVIKWMQGLKLFKKKESNKNHRIVELLVAGWLVFPFIVNLVRLISVFSKKGLYYSGVLKKLVHILHPDADLLYLTVRNALVAEKNTFLMRHMRGNKHITTVFGAGHVGIEDMIAMREETRLGNIKSLLPIIKPLIDPVYFYKSVRYVYNGRKWTVDRTIEIPHLKKLVI